jgi:uncharacterized small protein (DUF1192 family)
MERLRVKVISSYWSVENSLPWVLDVTFNEDANQPHQGHSAENLGLLSLLSVNLLNSDPTRLNLKMKHYKAGVDNDFLMKILAANAVE